ncbi:MAG: FAD-dependent oxidoreductase [Actinobacteria bacterium]|nr:FAD-dependent oxidoreductase [Actinomycetota bacterium]
MTAPDVEVAVVGGGVMGLATARSLAQAGRDVAVLEQFELGHDRGSSHGSSRIFRLSYPDAEWVALAQEALPLWRELEAECEEVLLELHGSIDVGEWKANRDALASCGAAFEVLDRTEAERRFELRLESGEQALFQAEGGVALADRALRALESSARAHGARLRELARVAAVRETGDLVEVELDGETVRARTVVVSAGAWAPRLVELDARPTLETTAYFACDRPIPSLVDGTIQGQVLGYALAAPGVGAKAGLHKSGSRVDPDEPGEPDEAMALAAGEWLARRLPAVSPEPVRIETCLYTNLADDRFTLERRGRVVVGSPCSGHGFKFAPLIGRRLAELATEPL